MLFQSSPTLLGARVEVKIIRAAVTIKTKIPLRTRVEIKTDTPAKQYFVDADADSGGELGFSDYDGEISCDDDIDFGGELGL